MKRTAIDDLIDEVSELCRIYCGKGAPSEQWLATCQRFDQMNKTVKRARRERARQLAPKETTTP